MMSKWLNSTKKNIKLQRSLDIDVNLLSPHEATEIIPHLSTNGLLAATICRRDGHLNPFTTTMTYAIGAQRLGVEICKYTEVTDIEVEQGKIKKSED